MQIPNSVSSIGREAFAGMTSVTHLLLPASLSRLGNNVIDNTGISEITIPAAVGKMGSLASKMPAGGRKEPRDW